MSWQAYVDSSLVGSGHIDQACIVSAAGDSVWATTTGFNPTPAEFQQIVAILAEKDKSNRPAVIKAYGDGIHVAGQRYVATRIEDEKESKHVYGRQGKSGIIIVSTKQAILIGHYGENVQVGNATQTVAALADYLIGLGY